MGGAGQDIVVEHGKGERLSFGVDAGLTEGTEWKNQCCIRGFEIDLGISGLSFDEGAIGELDDELKPCWVNGRFSEGTTEAMATPVISDVSISASARRLLTVRRSSSAVRFRSVVTRH